MNVVVDESVDRHIVERLRHDGHNVTYAAELDPGISDETVLQLANAQQALLLTADKDFGELTFRQNLFHHGVVLIRLSGLSNQTKSGIVADALRERGATLADAFGVISPGLIRIRKRFEVLR
jgi:predicted nuclease of predicted toxin-antitoxin system